MDEDEYLAHGANEQIYFHIFTSVEEIDSVAIHKLLHEALQYDEVKKKKTLRRRK